MADHHPPQTEARNFAIFSMILDCPPLQPTRQPFWHLTTLQFRRLIEGMDEYSNPAPIATAAQFKAALLAVRDRIGIDPKVLAMLRAHCRAPNHTTSTFQLSKELGHAGHGDVNKSYGRFAHDVCDALHVVLPPAPSGDPHWWRTLAFGNDDAPRVDSGHYEWIMRPELVQALQELKWA
jgi:hypothetical protein